MDKVEIKNFIDRLKEVIYVAGELAVKKQKLIVNTRKNIDVLDRDSDYVKLRRSAKTEVDEDVQELILSASSKLLDSKKIFLDAEEDTPSKKLFSNNPAYPTLVIDPIDGTLEYTLGKNGYRICVGLIEKGIMLTALVYFPARKELYYIEENSVFLETDEELEKIPAPSIKNKSIVYVNNRVDDIVRSKLKTAGYALIDDADGIVGWTDALLKCLRGEYYACIFHSPQIRDVLVGAMINKFPTGYMLNWSGGEITWPQGGRIPKVLFCFNSASKKLLSCLV